MYRLWPTGMPLDWLYWFVFPILWGAQRSLSHPPSFFSPSPSLIENKLWLLLPPSLRAWISGGGGGICFLKKKHGDFKKSEEQEMEFLSAPGIVSQRKKASNILDPETVLGTISFLKNRCSINKFWRRDFSLCKRAQAKLFFPSVLKSCN